MFDMALIALAWTLPTVFRRTWATARSLNRFADDRNIDVNIREKKSISHLVCGLYFLAQISLILAYLGFSDKF